MINSRVNTAEQLSPDRARISLATAEPNGPTALPLRKLPPLNALRCFEIAARHGSFTKAAEELFVTPAAVGQQVRQLEDFMGVALFRRENRRLSLTPAGESCLPGIREGFAQLATAIQSLGLDPRSGGSEPRNRPRQNCVGRG
jgi:Bacterial regulatory helix-turn-helix protein, lysR family